MVVDAGEDIGKIVLRVEAGEFGGLDDGYRIGDDLASDIGTASHQSPAVLRSLAGPIWSSTA